ncbi:MerR family transcriptional regulator [Geomicrobium sediminis]|uniref:DNA-binding transcriptional MerR regulator n=1 Tax=Geomicrobium sediminis TaxID=1347788 RepID=A0ABS2P874_9BACL|nr:MerR family transcriptional regulator [Geomicrobium sediminis]MBM7631590.1 DNA-binding transcriptional MerR regulator [Geomicrobium sediminis]
MYSIGQFSKMNRVTVKRLRYYDQVGIVTPAYTDPNTGYRYYRSNQIETLHRVLAMRQLDFSIAEIQEVISKQQDWQTMIGKKKEELEKKSVLLNRQLQQANYYLLDHSPPEIIVKSLPKVTVASMKLTLPHYDDLFVAYPAMGDKMRETNSVVDPIQYCFTRFYDGEFKETNINLEICEAVTEKKDNHDGLIFKDIAKVPFAACLLHRGPYETIGESHAKLYQWLEESDYSLAGPPREAVIDGIWNELEPTRWLTEVQFPLSHED